ncbi:type II toxin-antitoxin system RelE/ParE family toxin [Furfurilactobacillus milii]|jgi:mRNA interferase YafQ|uniref:type II toxin-antitoxin system RelE/ParE family toxin n=1 Tax=Furfurilactobacillus TaxID=2767882 RepID=UPI003B8A6C38|nr:hypothetical protein LROSL2_0457 [Furfurilactobacillus rossiae]QLE68240.1 hypothetical protein LROSL3_0458 [Furfurilactobacillus rossiae]
MLASTNTVDRVYHDHQLTGRLNGFRELHIEPDWLLIYKRDDAKLILLIVDTGSHAQLFGM